MYLAFVFDSEMAGNGRACLDFETMDEALKFAYDYAIDAHKSGATFHVEVANAVTDRTYLVYTPEMFDVS